MDIDSPGTDPPATDPPATDPPATDPPFDDHGLTNIEVHLDRSILETLQRCADRRDVSVDHLVRYILDRTLRSDDVGPVAPETAPGSGNAPAQESSPAGGEVRGESDEQARRGATQREPIDGEPAPEDLLPTGFEMKQESSSVLEELRSTVGRLCPSPEQTGSPDAPRREAPETPSSDAGERKASQRNDEADRETGPGSSKSEPHPSSMFDLAP